MDGWFNLCFSYMYMPCFFPGRRAKMKTRYARVRYSPPVACDERERVSFLSELNLLRPIGPTKEGFSDREVSRLVR